MKMNLGRKAMFVLFSMLTVSMLVGCGGSEAPQPSASDVDLSQADAVFNAPTTPETVVVVVDGKEITQGDVNKEMEKLMARMGGRVPPDQLMLMRDQMARQSMDNLIIQTLLTDAVEREQIEVTDEEIDTAMDELKEALPEGVTIEQVMAQAGFTEGSFRENLVEDLKVNKLLTQHASVEEPTEEEITQFYTMNKDRFDEPETVSASHILIAFRPDDDDEAKAAKRAQLEDLRQQLTNGADFAELAKAHSDCPSKERGGDLGAFRKGQMVPAFEEAAFNQAIGAIGPVVETQFGYHLIKVNEHNEPRTVGLEEMHDRIVQRLTAQKRQEGMQVYLEQLRDRASIVTPGEQPAQP